MRIFILLSLLSLSFSGPSFAERAIAELGGTEPGSLITGSVTFEEIETEQGLSVNVQVMNVPDGKHGFHIHEGMSCDNKGADAGGHFNPDSVQHGHVPKDGLAAAHPGDFGNIEVKDGSGSMQLKLTHLTLKEGKYGILDRTVILHEKEDDFGQPTGNAGGRIACGMIKSPEPE